MKKIFTLKHEDIKRKEQHSSRDPTVRKKIRYLSPLYAFKSSYTTDVYIGRPLYNSLMLSCVRDWNVTLLIMNSYVQ